MVFVISQFVLLKTRRHPSREAAQEHRGNAEQHHCGGERYNDEVREDRDQRNVVLLKNQDRERRAPADEREAEYFAGSMHRSVPDPLPTVQ